MSGRPLIIFGAGEIAEVAAFYFGHDGGRRVAAFMVDDAFVREASFAGCPVVPFSEVGRRFGASEHDAFVAIG